MAEQQVRDKQDLSPLLVGGVAGSMLGFVTAKSERSMTEHSHLIVGSIIGGLLGGLILHTAQKLRKE